MRRKRGLLKKFWTDHTGKSWRLPNTIGRLRPHQIECHAALRTFVFTRDSYMCRKCRRDGELVVDHIVSWRNGGTHHPDNLQTLCKPCNDRKARYHDRGLVDPMRLVEIQISTEMVCV